MATRSNMTNEEIENEEIDRVGRGISSLSHKDVYNKLVIPDLTIKVENVEEKENRKYFPRFTTGCGVDCGCHLRNKKIYKEEDLG